MKRFLFINKSLIQISFFWFALIYLVGSCSEPTPNDALTKYLDARYVKMDYKKAMKYLSTKDKPIYEEYSPLLPQKKNPIERYIADRTSYTIISLDISGDQATAKVVIEKPNPLSDFDISVSDSLTDAIGGSDFEEKIEKLYAKKYNGKSIPLMTYKKKYNLIKEINGWKVYLDLESKKRNRRFLGDF